MIFNEYAVITDADMRRNIANILMDVYIDTIEKSHGKFKKAFRRGTNVNEFIDNNKPFTICFFDAHEDKEKKLSPTMLLFEKLTTGFNAAQKSNSCYGYGSVQMFSQKMGKYNTIRFMWVPNI